MNLHGFFKFSTLGSISHCGNTLWAMNFIIYDPAGKERNILNNPKLIENSFLQIILIDLINLLFQIKTPTSR